MEALKFFNLALGNLIFPKGLALSYTAFTCRFKFKYELGIKFSFDHMAFAQWFDYV